MNSFDCYCLKVSHNGHQRSSDYISNAKTIIFVYARELPRSENRLKMADDSQERSAVQEECHLVPDHSYFKVAHAVYIMRKNKDLVVNKYLQVADLSTYLLRLCTCYMRQYERTHLTTPWSGGLGRATVNEVTCMLPIVCCWQPPTILRYKFVSSNISAQSCVPCRPGSSETACVHLATESGGC